MPASKKTPMLEQYLSIKGEYPDAILFYRMGDFYEMFYEDAEVASRALEITLTSRNKNEKVPVPMCGVPAKAAKGYLSKLIEQGYKVAICDQVEDPSKAKGLVKRDVVRVITPGMLMEDELPDARANNFILAVCSGRKTIGISFLDISTGDFKVCEAGDLKRLVDEVLRVRPSEVLFAESLRKDRLSAEISGAVGNASVSWLPDRAFEHGRSRERLLEQFNTVSLEGFGCENMKAGVSAAGAVLFYVRETQKQDVTHLSKIEPYMLDQFLQVDDLSCGNLELVENIRTRGVQGTLLSVLDKTATSMGGRLLRQWIRYPLVEKDKILARLDAVEEAFEESNVRGAVREKLKSVYDLERLGSKISMGQCNAKDLTALKKSIRQLPEIIDAVSGLRSELYQGYEDPSPLYELAVLIDMAIREDAPPVINEGGIIREGYDETLDELIRIGSDGKGFLARLEAEERQKTGINSLKVRYNKVFGYYIEVPKAHAETVPPHYVRKQTLVNAERYITDELKTFEHKVLGAEEQRASLEYEIFDRIRKQVAARNRLVRGTAEFLARLDCLLDFAEVAARDGYHRPRINTDGVIRIDEGRHPVVEKMVAGERFVPKLHSHGQPGQPGSGRHRSQHGWQIHGPEAGGSAVDHGPHGKLRACRKRGHHRHRPDIYPRGRAGQPLPGPEHVHGGNGGDRQHPQQRYIRQPRHPDEIGRGTSTFDGPEHRVGRGRVLARPQEDRRQDPVRHPLPRIDRSCVDKEQGEKLQYRGEGMERRDHLSPKARRGRDQSQLRHTGRPTRRHFLRR